MRRRALAALVVILVATGPQGCFWQAGTRQRLDATGLKYVAEERIENRTAADDRANGKQRAAHLEGFTREVPVVDGKIELTLEEAVRRTLLHSLDNAEYQLQQQYGRFAYIVSSLAFQRPGPSQSTDADACYLRGRVHSF